MRLCMQILNAGFIFEISNISFGWLLHLPVNLEQDCFSAVNLATLILKYDTCTG